MTRLVIEVLKYINILLWLLIFVLGDVAVRDGEKVMRGMITKDSAQKIIEAMRIHYNFCREHSKLWKTPAEASGIKMRVKINC